VELENKKFYLAQIMSGYTICKVKDIDLLVGTPTPIAKMYAERAYKDALEKCMYAGIMDSEEKKQLMIRTGQWNPIEDADFEKLPEEIENLKVDLYNAYFNYKHRDAIKKNLDKKKKRFHHLALKKDRYETVTAQGYASVIRQKYLICGGTKTLDMKPYWDGLSFLFDNSHFIDALITKYVNERITDDIIRELSHSEPWRTIWSVGKTESNIFGIPSTELTESQRNLMLWSRIYDSVYESIDCPPEEVIEDNDMLDGWLIVQHRKRQKERKEQHGKKRGSGAQEEFVIVENPEDVARVEAMNSPQAKLVKAQRLGVLNKHGKLSEQYMPDSKMKIREQAHNQTRQQMQKLRRR
jgi:hypothetical protein